MINIGADLHLNKPLKETEIMKAMVAEKQGSPDVFQMKDVPKPQIRAGHLLVEVRATSVNPIDAKIRQRELPFSPVFPAILHGDFSGVVSEVGDGVSGFKVGDSVYGVGGGVKGTHGGALAEFLLVDADLTSSMPNNLTFEEAATLPLVAVTSWEALVDKLRIYPGSTLLVHGGVGGVGHIAAQLGTAKGAVVHTTVGSAEDAETSKNYGSSYPINYKSTSVADYVDALTQGKGFDFVFETVGGPNMQNSFQAAKLNGSIASIATGGSHDLNAMYVKGLSLHSVLMLIPLMTGQNRAHYGKILFEFKKLIEAGHIKPLVHKEIFDWKDVSKAHALLESGGQKGKIAVRVGK